MTMNRKPRPRLRAAAALLIAALCACCATASAQEFKVGSFRTLPNDVSAFITPVRDLNGDACALVKVVATPDFAFSSPLGIVSRRDEVGEIWLYLPRGSRSLTLKHPSLGVLRDYRFPAPLESHVAYELTVSMPQPAKPDKPDTVVLTKTVVDTVTIARRRPRLPLAVHALATAAFHAHGPSWGIMAVAMRRHGAFVHAQTDFRSTGDTRMECNRDGLTADGGPMPYYTGHTRHSNFAVTAGPVHYLGHGLSLFYGAGYGRTATAWQLAESEGGGYALNEGLTHSGVAAEAGALFSLGRISIAASAVTVAGKQWQACVAVGIRLFKGKKAKGQM